MPITPSLQPRWSTSSLGDPADMTEQDNRALGEHLCLCVTLRGPLQAMGGGLAWVQGLLAGRAVTTVALAGLLALVGWMVV